MADGQGRVAGKVAIVTGAAGGIGSETVRKLVSEGARVVAADMNVDGARAVAAELGDAVSSQWFDAEDVTSIEALVAAAVERYGRLDVLHNNAALMGPELADDTTAVDIDFALWDKTMAINVRAYLASCKYAIPHMIAGGGGSIINMGSGAGHAGNLARIAYGTSKGAVMSMSKFIATQHGKEGVRCNAIAPGLVVTASARVNTPELIEMMRRHVLNDHVGEPSDIANLVCYLASDESVYLTGQTISIDGGTLAHQPWIAELRDTQQ